MTINFKSLLLSRLKSEFEIYLLMAVFGVWYLINIGGAMKGDETIFALQGYYLLKGNMSAEQFRPMSRYFYGLGMILFGRNTFGAKFFILILGILTIYLTYIVTKALTDRVKAFLASFILGIVPLYGDLSVSGLMDIILAFFVILLFFFVLRYLQTHDLVRRQRLLFIAGVLSVCTLSTKLYGVFFSLVVFLFLTYNEWGTIKTIQLLKRKNMVKRLKKNLILLPVFIVLGVLAGLIIRAQLGDFWENAGEKGRADVLNVLPEFLDNIVLDMNSSGAYGFFILVGIVLFFILWILCAFLMRESIRALIYLAKKKRLSERYHMLIYILGTLIGFLIIYSPFLHNPVTLFTQILLNQTIHLKQSSPKVVGGVLYDTSPWWSYLYWFYEYLGLMFVVGTIISLLYIGYKYFKKTDIAKEEKLLLLFTFVPFILLSALSLKTQNYFVILFPLFSIYMVVQVTSLVKRITVNLSMESLKSKANILSIAAIIVLMMLPGPLWMTIDDPSLGTDSGYDVVGELVIDYLNDNPDEDVRVIAFDVLSVEYYLPDDVLNKIEILPLFSDNFSKDILGRPYSYYPDEELYDLVLNNEIDILVDEPSGALDRSSLVRNYVAENITTITRINDEVFVYYL